jgi:carboxymethylenebutenolidase
MMALNIDTAAKDMSGGVDLLLERTGSANVGVVGYCMGGALALVVAAHRPDAVAACAPYYGVIGWPSAQPDWSALTAKVEGEYAEFDDYAGPEASAGFQAQLRSLGKDATLHVHAGTSHAFFNDTRPEVFDAVESAVAFDRTVALFRSTL